jgi:Fe-S-cluster-containing hydrogenase component 2
LSELKIAVLICSCSNKNSSKLQNLDSIKGFCSRHPNISFIKIVDELCMEPGLLKRIKGQADGLLVLGCTEQKYLDKWKDVLESTGIPLFACEFADIKRRSLKTDDASGEYVRLLINAYTAKILAGWEVAKKAEPVGIIKMFESIDKPLINRREFFKMPLKLGKYEEVPVINSASCIAASSSCQLCVDSCSTGALVKKDGKICLREEKCIKCGWCTVCCPFGCIQIPSFTGPAGLALLENLADGIELDDGLSLIISCAAGCQRINKLSPELLNEHSFLIVQVPSLASVSYLHLIRAVELGFNRIILLCPESNCPRQKALKKWEGMFSFIKELLEGGGVGCPLQLGKMHDKSAVEQFFNLLKPDKRSNNMIGNQIKFDSEEKDCRLKFARSLSNLVNTRSKMNKYYDSPLPFYCISIEPEKCSMCGSCWEKCPCQAITMEETPEGNIIKHNYSKCIGCGTCVENCAEKAISINKALDMESLFEEANVAVKIDDLIKCKGCQKIIGTRSFIEKVREDLINSGWANSIEKIYYCSDCQVMELEHEMLKAIL